MQTQDTPPQPLERTSRPGTSPAGEQHWGEGADSALARLRGQERAKAAERPASRNPAGL